MILSPPYKQAGRLLDLPTPGGIKVPDDLSGWLYTETVYLSVLINSRNAGEILETDDKL